MNREQKLDALLSEARWRRALRYTESCTLATMFMGCVVTSAQLGMSLVLAGSITFMLARAVK